MYSSSLQYITLGNAYHHNVPVGESRVCIISSSIESLPHPLFMDQHHPHFIGRSGETLEDVSAPEGEITTITRFPTVETTGCTIFTLSITGRISKLGQHLHILQNTHTHSDSITTKRTSFNDISPLNKYAKRSLLPFLGDTLSWLTRTATPKDVEDIKKRVNQFIETQNQHQKTLVHIISILLPDMPCKLTDNTLTPSWQQLTGHTTKLPHSSTSPVQYIPT